MTVTHLADASSPPRVAYTIGRQVGPAVVRNRLRRRLRAIVRDVCAVSGSLPAGDGAYLVGVRPDAASLGYAELAETVTTALRRLQTRGSS